VNVLDAADDLLEDLTGLLLAHSLSADDVVEELAFLHELHHQEEMLRRFNNFVELDDVRVSY
jgi:hypothetical protein